MVITTQNLHYMSFLLAVMVITTFWLVYAIHREIPVWFQQRSAFCFQHFEQVSRISLWGKIGTGTKQKEKIINSDSTSIPNTGHQY